MRNYMKILLAAATASLLLSGCGAGPRVTADLLVKDKKVKGMYSSFAFTPDPNTKGYAGYQDANNAEYKCSVEFTVHAIASKAIENGYPYFTVSFPKGSTTNPVAITSTDKIVKYCTPTYYDKESNLLDDKCDHIGLGQGTPGVIRNVKATYFKKRNPFVPVWSAKKALRDTEKELIGTCWNGDTQGFRKAVSTYNNFGKKEI